jgi:hypothetical protein
MSNNNEEPKSNNKTKRVLAWIGIALVVIWFSATMLLAVLPIPNKDKLFPFFIFGCIVIPILIWVIIWIVGLLTGKRTVASFRSEETQKMMDEADEIRYREIVKETENPAEESDEEQSY